jgi:hypothetical protein
MRRPALLVTLILVVGIVGTVVALGAREGNPQFTSRQRDLAPVGAGELERLILTTSDPRPGYAGHARTAQCSSSALGGLRNPWTCLVGYRRPPRVRYTVTVHADRSIEGSGEPVGGRLHGVLLVSGCCVSAAP